MAKIPNQKRLASEEYPKEVQKWIGKLLSPLNSFTESVANSMNKRLTITDNMSGEIKEVILDGTYPIKFAWTLSANPKVAFIGYCHEVDGNHTNFTNAPFLDWEFTSDGKFQINTVTSISPTPANKYLIRIISFTG